MPERKPHSQRRGVRPAGEKWARDYDNQSERERERKKRLQYIKIKLNIRVHYIDN